MGSEFMAITMEKKVDPFFEYTPYRLRFFVTIF